MQTPKFVFSHHFVCRNPTSQWRIHRERQVFANNRHTHWTVRYFSISIIGSIGSIGWIVRGKQAWRSSPKEGPFLLSSKVLEKLYSLLTCFCHLMAAFRVYVLWLHAYKSLLRSITMLLRPTRCFFLRVRNLKANERPHVRHRARSVQGNCGMFGGVWRISVKNQQ